MKTQISLIFLLSFLSSFLCEDCTIYKCLNSSQIADDMLCQITDETNKQKTISVKPCPSGYKCNFDLSSFLIGAKYCTNFYSPRQVGENV